MDTENRIPEIKDDFGISYCNITRCCTEVCPAGIQITDNALIPLKERVVTEYFDPLVNPIKAVGNLTSGVLSYFSEDFAQTLIPGTISRLLRLKIPRELEWKRRRSLKLKGQKGPKRFRSE